MRPSLLCMLVAIFGLVPGGAGAANTPPSISPISDQVDLQSTPIRIPFTVWDAETPADRLRLRLVSFNPTLWPEVDACGTIDAGFCFSGTGSNRTVTLTPAGTNLGKTEIAIIVADEDGLTATNSFGLTVVEDTLHTVAPISDQVTLENTPTGTIPFSVVGDGNTAGDLTVVGMSDNQELVPDANIVFGGRGSTRTVTVTPAANRSGTAVITIITSRVSDGQVVNISSFALWVKFSLQIASVDGRLAVTWTDTSAALQVASQITGPWRDIDPVPSSPYTTATSETKFYRLRKR